MIEKIRDLEPGDEAFILNSARTGTRQVFVTRSQDGIIRVQSDDDDRQFDFDAESGDALVRDEGRGIPALVLPTDPRIPLIEAQRLHRVYRVEVERFANETTHRPTEGNFDNLVALVERWRAHSQDRTELAR